MIQRVTYSLAGQRIAVRVTGDPDPANNGLFYIHSDHPSARLRTSLGSTSVLTKYSDGYIRADSLTRYAPFGSYRTEPMATLTDRGFTGHKTNNTSATGSLGLIYMNARYFLPGTDRFLSADTIVPNPQNPQSLNRYTYTLNSPLNYIDPSGHCVQYATNDNMDAFTECMDAWNQLSQAYGRIAKGSDAAKYPNAYVNGLLETGTTEEILEMLETIGPAAERVQQAHLQEISSGCIPMQGGVLNCPPEGGWPEYAFSEGRISVEVSIGSLSYNSDKDVEFSALWEFTGFCIVGAGLVPARLWATTRVRPYTP